MANLFFFTASYPFENSESFIEEEIKYLSMSFDHIEIVPLVGRPPQTRVVPNNCIVHNPIITSRFLQYTKGLWNWQSFKIFIADFFKSKVYRNKLAIKTWFIAYVQSCNILKSKSIIDIFKRINKSDVCYFYWGKGCNVLPAFFPDKAHYVSRFHGEWDLWEETSGGYGPLRGIIAARLDSAVFISELGRNYFTKRYPFCPTALFPLGSPDQGICSMKRNGSDVIEVVSCSTIYPLKRVDLIYDSLRVLVNKNKVHWTHIGGGALMENLKSRIEDNPIPELDVSLLGNKSHTEVLEIYKTKYFDIFINLSTNEGVPVSIMEAISFGIPVVATDVGATSEVVQPIVGMLVNRDVKPNEVSNAIEMVLSRKDEYQPRAFWEKNYSAEANYKAFSEYLISISKQ